MVNAATTPPGRSRTACSPSNAPQPATFTRREALRLGLAGTGVALAAPWFSGALPSAAADMPAVAHAPFSLPPLPYPVDALEPHIDARTMEIHHGKHHAGYVAKLNAALESEPDLAGLPLEALLTRTDLPEPVATAVRNNGGGHHNHALFWTSMKKDGGGSPAGTLAKRIDDTFSGYDSFKERFTQTALGVFGSGWAWLCLDAAKTPVILGLPNQDSPFRENLTPLLGLDVWEHAYYLHFQNRRADYVAAWFNVIDWDAVAARHEAAMKA